MNYSLGVVIPSLGILAFPFVFAKALHVQWLLVAHYAPLGTAAAAVVALLTYWRNNTLESDRVLSIKAKEALEYAFETFTTPPKDRRYTWLATSRMLLGFKRLKIQLRTIPYQDACLIEEAFWKQRLYAAITDLSTHLQKVLSTSTATNTDDQIEPRSALVVLNFTKMDSDPIDEVDESEPHGGSEG